MTPAQSEPKSIGSLVWWTPPEAATPAALRAALEDAGLGKYLKDQPAYSAQDLAAVFHKVAADLQIAFQVKARSGVYFLPAGAPDPAPMARALAALGGSISALGVTDDLAGLRVAREAVRDGLVRLAVEADRLTATFTPGTDRRTLQAMAARLTALRQQAEGFAALLGKDRDAVMARVEAARGQLRAKVKQATEIAV